MRKHDRITKVQLSLHICVSSSAPAFFTTKLVKYLVSASPVSRPLLVSVAEKTRPRGYETFFMLNSAEHEINPAHKC